MVYNKWAKEGCKSSERNIIFARSKTNKLIRKAKTNYYTKLGNKLPDPKPGHEIYWTVFKRIVNKKVFHYSYGTKSLNKKLKFLMITLLTNAK